MMDHEEYERWVKSPAIQDMILSNQIGGVAYELSKRLNISPARALDLFYRSKTCADLHNRATASTSTATCILPMNSCWSAKGDFKDNWDRGHQYMLKHYNKG